MENVVNYSGDTSIILSDVFNIIHPVFIESVSDRVESIEKDNAKAIYVTFDDCGGYLFWEGSNVSTILYGVDNVFDMIDKLYEYMISNKLIKLFIPTNFKTVFSFLERHSRNTFTITTVAETIKYRLDSKKGVIYASSMDAKSNDKQQIKLHSRVNNYKEFNKFVYLYSHVLNRFKRK